MRHFIPLLFAAGCVWATPLPDAVVADMCAACSETEACDERGRCDPRCDDPDDFQSATCVDPARICLLGDCVLPCVDADCPGGFRCEYEEEPILNRCETVCFEDSDCRSNFRCCEFMDDEDCDSYTCVRR